MNSFDVVTATPPTGGDLRDAETSISAAFSSGLATDIHRKRMLGFVATHPDALLRSCVEGHLTGSALVVDDARERVLLMLHTKLGLWLQPGGHADGEGHLAAVALREATEETGIDGLRVAAPAVDCDVHRIPERGKELEHLHFDVRYVVVAPARAAPKGNHESRELRWVTLVELSELVAERSLSRLAGVGLAYAQQIP